MEFERVVQDTSSDESSGEEDEDCAEDSPQVDSDLNEVGPTLSGWICNADWEIYKGRKFQHVFDKENAFIEENRRMRQAPDSEERESKNRRFSVALSGGGVRAAAFAAGVVWRLAEQGKLKDVDHIAAVSGGSYFAAALASHLVEMSQVKPSYGAELDEWYLRATARTIARMQENTPYLARDLGKDPFSTPTDGSSHLPRIFDIPIMVGVFSFAVLARTLLMILLVIIPLVEVIETLYGAEMRMNFCADVFAPKLIFVTPLGVSSLDLNLLLVLAAVFVVFVMHCLLQLMRTFWQVKQRKVCLWLLLRSLISVAMRILVCWLILTGLICGPVNWRFHRYQTEGATDLRQCQCRDFILSSARLQCGDQLWQQKQSLPIMANPTLGYVKWLEGHPEKCSNFTISPDKADYHLERFPDLFQRNLAESFFPQVMLLLFLALLLAILLLPILPDAFLLIFNIAGPLVIFLITFFLVQWRVLGLVTSERLFGFHSDLTDWVREWWPWVIKFVLLLDIALVCGIKYFKNAAHIFYARSMRKAFYASGEDWNWGDIGSTPHCPYLIFCTTVHDYMRPGDISPVAEFAFGTRYTGGDRTGYRPTWQNQSVAKSSALSGGALDGFILGFYDSLSFRFWLEFLGVQMGSFIRFRRSRAPSTFTKLPGILIFVVVYVLLLIGTCMAEDANLQECSRARVVFLFAILAGISFMLLSFFDFLPCLAAMHHSQIIRSVHQATQFYHQSQVPPSVVYLSDGGVLDNTGIVQLLRRRCARILSVYAEDDADDVFCSLKEVFRITEQERLGSFYNPIDPRRSVWHTVQDYVDDQQKTYLHLCIRYGPTQADEGTGHLFLVKNRLPPLLSNEPVRELLTEDEILGKRPAACPDAELGHVLQAELGGCCCDCCHHYSAFNRCCGTFPAPPTSNQWLTPQYFCSLARLGHAISASALKASDSLTG